MGTKYQVYQVVSQDSYHNSPCGFFSFPVICSVISKVELIKFKIYRMKWKCNIFLQLLVTVGVHKSIYACKTSPPSSPSLSPPPPITATPQSPSEVPKLGLHKSDYACQPLFPSLSPPPPITMTPLSPSEVPKLVQTRILHFFSNHKFKVVLHCIVALFAGFEIFNDVQKIGAQHGVFVFALSHIFKSLIKIFHQIHNDVKPPKNIERFDVDARFTDAVRYGDLVFMSGQVPENGNTIQEQTESALTCIDTALAKAGTDKTRILELTIWLSDMAADYDGMNAVYDKWCASGMPPCRACVQAKLANNNWKIEIRVVAAIK